jgi:ankyrin repeat protein
MANTPLHGALAGRRNEVVKMVVSAGADVIARQHAGWVPLHSAAANGDRETVDLLIAHGANRSAVNDAGVSASAIARERGHEALADYLDRGS